MKRIKNYILFAIALVISGQVLYSQNEADRKILVLGSSVAAGWVTSYQEKYDFKNGYAFRLERYLAERGFKVINKGIPGDNTSDALKRFDEDVLPEKPDYVLIGLSMSNEGLETEDPDSVSISFDKGIKELIRKCKVNDIYPVLGLCYANNNFTSHQYECLKKMNIRMNTFGYPCINFLGALNDGNGNFPEGTTFDPNHPDNRGHEEFFLSIEPGLFESIDKGKEIPEWIRHDSQTRIGKKSSYEQLYYYPEGIMHSFSFGFEFLNTKSSKLAEIILFEGVNELIIDKDGCLEYKGSNKAIKSKPLETGKWYKLMMVHRYLDEKTLLFIDDQQVGELVEQIDPAAFILGNPGSKGKFRNLLIYRSALNKDEVIANSENLIHASLACYASLEDGDITNKAQSLSAISSDLGQYEELLSASMERIRKTNVERGNELEVVHKKAIEIDPAIYKDYVGKYLVAEGDFFMVETEDKKLYFVDRGRKAEIKPESEDKFFIHYPGDLTFTFDRDDTGSVVTLEANFNGFVLKGIKEN